MVADDVLSFITGSFTVILHRTLAPLICAVIYAIPALSVLTWPVESTVAMELLLLDYDNVAPLLADPLSLAVFPLYRVFEDVNVIVGASAAAVTVTLTAALTLLVAYAVILAVQFY